MEAKLKFRPMLIEYRHRIINGQPGFLVDAVNAAGGTFHFLLPQSFVESLKRIGQVFEKNNVSAHICYATKVNRRNVCLEESACHALGIDVSSLNELRASRAYGISGQCICVSGPIMDRRFLELAIRVNALISVESKEELGKINNITRSCEAGRGTRVLLRVEGSKVTKSRFGMTQDDISASPKDLQIHRRESVDFECFDFHIVTASIAARPDAISHLLDRMDQFEASGRRASVVNMRIHNNM